MQSKIHRNMFFLTFLGIIFTTVLLMISFYNLFSLQMKNNIKSKAELLEKSIMFEESKNPQTNNPDYINSLKLTNQEARVSIIAQDGKVIFDSYKDAENLENHLDRPEIQEAYERGYGDVKRFSKTLGEETYYYAIKLSDNTVLRLAQTTNSIYGIFIKAIPMILLVLIIIFVLCSYLAGRLTKKIIQPINDYDFDQDNKYIYDELSHFVKTIIAQKEQINNQILILENRTNTTNSIIENMKEGLILLDKNQMILSSNKSATRLFDYKNNDYLGKNILELTRNIELIQGIKMVLAGKRYDTTLNFSSQIIQVYINPVFLHDEINGVIILFLDITERLNAEKMRQEFTANVSHELKTPLTTIFCLSEMIDNGMAKPDDIKGFAGKIKNEASRLITLIEDIIMLSELDEKINQKQFEPFNLLMLANEVADNLKQSAEEKSIQIQVIGLSFFTSANRRMIYELLYNLIENGIKYNEQGGKVIVSLYEEDHVTRIKVEDNGIGIPKEHHERIFERFYRVDKSRSKKTGGTGLGLSIVKHIVQYHGGTIEIESDENVGTTINIYLGECLLDFK